MAAPWHTSKPADNQTNHSMVAEVPKKSEVQERIAKIKAHTAELKAKTAAQKAKLEEMKKSKQVPQVMAQANVVSNITNVTAPVVPKNTSNVSNITLASKTPVVNKTNVTISLV